MEQRNDQYVIDGIPVLDLIAKYGSPLYVYDTSKIQTQYNKLFKAFKKSDVRIYYACKALTNINILKFFQIE